MLRHYCLRLLTACVHIVGAPGELLAIKEVTLSVDGSHMKEAVEQLEQEVRAPRGVSHVSCCRGLDTVCEVMPEAAWPTTELCAAVWGIASILHFCLRGEMCEGPRLVASQHLLQQQCYGTEKVWR